MEFNRVVNMTKANPLLVPPLPPQFLLSGFYLALIIDSFQHISPLRLFSDSFNAQDFNMF